MKLKIWDIVTLLSMVNNVKVNNRGMWKFVDEVGELLELSDDEKKLCGWREFLVSGERAYGWSKELIFERGFNEEQTQFLLGLVDNPPPEVPRKRSEKAQYAELCSSLGGEFGWDE